LYSPCLWCHFFFGDSMWSFRVEANLCRFFFYVCLYICTCIAVGNPTIKRGRVGIHLTSLIWHIVVHVPDMILLVWKKSWNFFHERKQIREASLQPREARCPYGRGFGGNGAEYCILAVSWHLGWKLENTIFLSWI
jgi:hypothetical protein